MDALRALKLASPTRPAFGPLSVAFCTHVNVLVNVNVNVPEKDVACGGRAVDKQGAVSCAPEGFEAIAIWGEGRVCVA